MFAALNSFLTRAVSGYFLNKSLRFRSSASAYLNRTLTTPTSSTIYTWSAWVKRGALSATGYLFGASTTTNFGFNSSDQLLLTLSGTAAVTTTAVYRDPAAWYHLVYVQNGATQTIYVNGVSAGTGTTANTVFNTAIAHQLAAANTTGYFDGELAEVNFVDGQALAPTAFGATGANSQWLPKAYAGTYGTNGFYLPFTNTTSTTTLVADSSGNANNWTPNNISLTAGSTYDSLTDVPTLTSETVANYAVLNPLDAALAPTNGNLTFTQPSAAYASVRGSIGVTTGSWAWEVYINAGSPTGAVTALGIANNFLPRPFAATVANAWMYDMDGLKYIDGTGPFAYGATYTAGDTIRFEFNATSGSLTAFKNNVSQGVLVSGLPAGTYFPWVALYNLTITPSVSFNFGQQAWTNAPTLGYLALNTFNIAAGTVTTSGTFTGNASTDGPMVWLNGTPTAMTINGNAVTFGTHADKLANGFKVRSSSASYNASGSNTYVATTVAEVLKYENAQPNP